MRANFLNGSGMTDFTGAVGLDGLLVVFVGVLIIGDWLTFCLVFWSASWVFFSYRWFLWRWLFSWLLWFDFGLGFRLWFRLRSFRTGIKVYKLSSTGCFIVSQRQVILAAQESMFIPQYYLGIHILCTWVCKCIEKDKTKPK
jgi:hypothetical protein